MRILIIEDDQQFAEALMVALKREGFVLDWCSNIKTAQLQVIGESFDVILLDLTLPDGDGLKFLTLLRQGKGLNQQVPVLIMTARDQLNDRLEGLNLGADDYLSKPFASAELVARVRALHRRSLGQTQNLLVVGQLTMNPQTHQAWWQDTQLTLSRREFDLLYILASYPERVFSKSQLEQKIYSYDDEVGSNTIEVYVHSLRKKTDQKLIQNLRGVGYRINTKNEQVE